MRRNDARKMDREALAQLRIRAVSQIKKGASPEDVAKTLDVNRTTVYGWLSRFAEGGYDNLKRKKAPGRAPSLDGTQMRILYYTVVDSTPEQMKMPFALWSCGLVREFIRRRFGINLSKVTVSRVLARIGLSFQRPLQRSYEQNTTLVKNWLKKEYPKLLALAKREKAEIFFEDESGVRSDAQVGKTWGRVGKTPVVRATGKRFGMNLVSAISPRGEFRFMITKGTFGAKEFVDFMKRLIATSKRKVFLIADGHPAHKSKLAREFLAEVGDKLRLFFLPPYSPELNPDELVWNTLKGEMGRMSFFGPGDMEAKVLGFMRRLQKSPDKVRSFFHERNVRYVLGNV